ncbi:pyridoxal-phosphate dependent enzyme [Mycolicibacterium komossense]|uniref:Pyridoxal-phosphate dependent enzyme n=1 Tax=Mycolicibacterium komossense TaxID=1779 RepID=A0ABT3CA30_9MYCO|nr:pyridoxal-phosphate dependent enzyme [Mycolicibacterium komossense]MCV7226329.1 pyridoxal-phosphate dependent enzyme [Mycolicibacterium komossense]
MKRTTAAEGLPALVCGACGARYDVSTLAWRCNCGGVFDIDSAPALDITAVQGSRGSLWRYESVLPVPFDAEISLGEGRSPIVEARGLPNVGLKADFLMPTLSFKDRGAVVLATLAKRLGVTSALVDSSGNAGTAAAAYFARAGIPIQVFVPASTSPGKLAQMRAHGAELTLVSGTRADTSSAALDAAEAPGVFYASHVFHPYFLHGVKTYGYEIWEHCGGELPSTVVVPVGNGTMLLGCYLAFRELVGAGLAARMPTLVAVQAAGCSPLEVAFAARQDTVAPVQAQPTVAEGIAIAAPPRGAQILAAVRATGGTVVAVSDAQVRAGRAELAAQGLYVEPTSAVCWAAARVAATPAPERPWNWELAVELLRADNVIIPLCGAGLKAPG